MALTMQTFEFHLILKMVTFQHAISDEDTILVSRSAFHDKETNLKYIYIVLAIVYLVGQPLMLFNIGYVFCALIYTLSRLRHQKYIEHRWRLFL